MSAARPTGKELQDAADVVLMRAMLEGTPSQALEAAVAVSRRTAPAKPTAPAGTGTRPLHIHADGREFTAAELESLQRTGRMPGE